MKQMVNVIIMTGRLAILLKDVWHSNKDHYYVESQLKVYLKSS